MLVVLASAAASPAAAPLQPTAQNSSSQVRSDAAAATPMPITQIRNRLRVPELTPAACLGFLQIGGFLLWEIVEDDLAVLTIALFTAAAVGAILGAALAAAAGVGVAALLVIGGASPFLFLLLGITAAALGSGLGAIAALPAGAAVGLAVSIDDGEVGLAF